jgi:hypothetical protein
MNPRRLILLCNPSSIKADGKPVGGRPAYTPADAAYAFCDSSPKELAAFAFRWGGWDSEYERCFMALLDVARRNRDEMPKDEETLLRLVALVLREERRPQTYESRAAWMGCKRAWWHRHYRKPYARLSQAFEVWCSVCERKASKRLKNRLAA